MPGDNLISQVAKHFFTDEFQAVIDAWVKENACYFTDVSDEKEMGEDNNLQYYEMYTKFISLFESKLESFVRAEDYSVEEFYEKCAKVSTDKEDWSEEHMFINLLLATSDYKCFLSLMKEEGSKYKERIDKVEMKVDGK